MEQGGRWGIWAELLAVSVARFCECLAWFEHGALEQGQVLLQQNQRGWAELTRPGWAELTRWGEQS